LTLGTAGEVWVSTQGLEPSPGAETSTCSSEAFALALRAQRPGIVVHAWNPENAPAPPPDDAVQARLARQNGVVTLDVRGPGVAFSRTLPATDPCERNVATSALIVDGALDVLRVPTSAPRVGSLAPPVPFFKQLHLSAALGAGIEQGVFGFVPAFAVEGAVRYRYLEVTLDADIGLASQTTFTILPPEATRSGTLSAVRGSGELGVGIAPRLGPGRLGASLAFGLSFTQASASSTGIFQQQPQTATEPFGALRLGYALDLPRGLFVAVRAEERVTRAATFGVEGAEFPAPFGQDGVTTPVWTFQCLAFVGYHFS
jgi:hypothetical protein